MRRPEADGDRSQCRTKSTNRICNPTQNLQAERLSLLTASVTLPSVEASSITRPGDARGTRAAPPSDAIHEFDPFVAEVEELAARGGGFDTQPVVVRRTSDVLPNAHLGVAGGYQVEVLFVGTTLARGWLDALPVETRAWVQGHKEAAGMPHVSTMKIDYDPELASLLSQLASWTVLEARGAIDDLFAMPGDSRSEERGHERGLEVERPRGPNS